MRLGGIGQEKIRIYLVMLPVDDLGASTLVEEMDRGEVPDMVARYWGLGAVEWGVLVSGEEEDVR